MNIKTELLEYLVRSCVREVIEQVKEADPNSNKSDFHTDKGGTWCKWCGEKASPDALGINRCNNKTCKANSKKNKWLKEADTDPKDASVPPITPPAPPTGAGVNPMVPTKKDTTPEPEMDGEVAPSGICFVNPRNKSELIKLFKEPSSSPKAKVGKKPKKPGAPPVNPPPATPPSPTTPPPMEEAISPMAAYSQTPPKQLTRDMIERIIYYTAARFAGSSVKIAGETLREVEKAIKSDSTLFLYIGKFDETSEEIYVLTEHSLQLARSQSLPPAELGGAAAPPAPEGTEDFDPNLATDDDMARFMDKEAPGKVKSYGAPEDLGEATKTKLCEVKHLIKKLVNEVLDK